MAAQLSAAYTLMRSWPSTLRRIQSRAGSLLAGRGLHVLGLEVVAVHGKGLRDRAGLGRQPWGGEGQDRFGPHFLRASSSSRAKVARSRGARDQHDASPVQPWLTCRATARIRGSPLGWALASWAWPSGPIATRAIAAARRTSASPSSSEDPHTPHVQPAHVRRGRLDVEVTGRRPSLALLAQHATPLGSQACREHRVHLEGRRPSGPGNPSTIDKVAITAGAAAATSSSCASVIFSNGT